MKIALLVLLVSLSAVANADVFKCSDQQGKINYQAKPCEIAEKGKQLPIKPDPEKEAEAKIKMQSLQAEYDNNKLKEKKQSEIDQQTDQLKQIIGNNLPYQQNSNAGIVMPASPPSKQ
jgi:hypothetical protein